MDLSGVVVANNSTGSSHWLCAIAAEVKNAFGLLAVGNINSAAMRLVIHACFCFSLPVPTIQRVPFSSLPVSCGPWRKHAAMMTRQVVAV